MDFQEIFQKTLASESARFRNKTVLDLPAGEGRTSQWLHSLGAKVISLDLFPRFFKAEGLTCEFCDLNREIPLDDESVDEIVSQEGIEHIPDQVNAFKQFSRVLKPQGRLIITCPNGSSLNSKLSHLLGESERHSRIMPANKADGLWFIPQAQSEVYFGHLFIPTATKLRLLGEIAGLELRRVYFSELKLSNLFWFVFFYPFIFLTQLKNFLRNSRKKPSAREEFKKVFLLSINPKVLLDGSLFMEFVKKSNPNQARDHLKKQWDLFQQKESN